MSKVIAFVVLLALFGLCSANDGFKTFAGESAGVVQHSGYLEANTTYGAYLFYWMFESQNEPTTDPFVIWLTGGPGCSSLLALFFENGPFTVGNNSNLIPNPYSWNTNANLMFVDQPAGTGFSYVNSNGYVTDEAQVAVDFYTFLTNFFNKYPQYVNNDLYITGESYGGHYVPAISAYILLQAKYNLKGASIGNGWVDPYYQAGAYGPFAYGHKLISKSALNQAQSQYQTCASDINNGDYSDAFDDCNEVFDIVLEAAGNVNYYDIRKQCDPAPLCYNFTDITNYLNTPSVQKSLGVKAGSVWETCDGTVYEYLESTDFEESYRQDVISLLAGNVSVLFYNGNEDLICNFYGTSALLNSMPWDGLVGFQKAANTTWVGPNGQNAGNYRTYQGLTYVVVFNAGHMVPHDQPAVALEMLRTFLSGGSFSN